LAAYDHRDNGEQEHSHTHARAKVRVHADEDPGEAGYTRSDNERPRTHAVGVDAVDRRQVWVIRDSSKRASSFAPMKNHPKQG
jgi:hypothetical protein